MLIRSLLDTDLYKLTMQQAVCRLYPTAEVEYVVTNRGQHHLTEEQFFKIENQIDMMAGLSLSKNDADYLNSLRYINPAYVDFLKGYRFNPKEVTFKWDDDSGLWGLAVKGPWYRTILWETPILAILSEVITDLKEEDIDHDKFLDNVVAKKGRFWDHNVKYADFGTRRRASFDLQRKIVAMLAHKDSTLVGTSNVQIAKEKGLKPIGTHAHEWYMFHGAKYGYRHANKMAMDAWSYAYEGDLGIALPDTFTSRLFFKHFTMKYAKLFDGVRHDSGPPLEFAEMAINHYKKLGIDPMSKTIVFSDGLNESRAIFIKESLRDRINCSFGIGTNLTNNFGKPAPNIVMKMRWARDHSFGPRQTIKVSDVDGKHCGPAQEIERCKEEYQMEDLINSHLQS